MLVSKQRLVTVKAQLEGETIYFYFFKSEEEKNIGKKSGRIVFQCDFNQFYFFKGYSEQNGISEVIPPV